MRRNTAQDTPRRASIRMARRGVLIVVADSLEHRPRSATQQFWPTIFFLKRRFPLPPNTDVLPYISDVRQMAVGKNDIVGLLIRLLARQTRSQIPQRYIIT